jgi:hypothetical protein
MQEWYEASYFPMSLFVKPEGSSQFYTLASWIQLCGDDRRPFLVVPAQQKPPAPPQSIFHREQPHFTGHRQEPAHHADPRLRYENTLTEQQMLRSHMMAGAGYQNQTHGMENPAVWGSGVHGRSYLDHMQQSAHYAQQQQRYGAGHDLLHQPEMPFMSVFGNTRPIPYASDPREQQRTLETTLGNLSLEARESERQRMLHMLNSKRFDPETREPPTAYQPGFPATSSFGMFSEPQPQWTSAPATQSDPHWPERQVDVSESVLQEDPQPTPMAQVEEPVKSPERAKSPPKNPWNKTSPIHTAIEHHEAPKPIEVPSTQDDERPKAKQVKGKEQKPAPKKNEQPVAPTVTKKASVPSQSRDASERVAPKVSPTSNSSTGWSKVGEAKHTSLREIQQSEIASSHTPAGPITISTSGAVLDSNPPLKSPAKFGPVWNAVNPAPVKKKSVLEIQREEEELAKRKAEASVKAAVYPGGIKTWSDTVASNAPQSHVSVCVVGHC